MKFQSIIRKGLVVAGFAAALALLPSAARSQEITNTEFSDGQYVTALPQPTAPTESVTVRMAVEPSQAMSADVAIANSVQPAQAAVQAPKPNAVVTFLLVLCAGFLALYTLITTDRKMAINRSSYITRNA